MLIIKLDGRGTEEKRKGRGKKRDRKRTGRVNGEERKGEEEGWKRKGRGKERKGRRKEKERKERKRKTVKERRKKTRNFRNPKIDTAPKQVYETTSKPLCNPRKRYMESHPPIHPSSIPAVHPPVSGLQKIVFALTCFIGWKLKFIDSKCKNRLFPTLLIGKVYVKGKETERKEISRVNMVIFQYAPCLCSLSQGVIDDAGAAETLAPSKPSTGGVSRCGEWDLTRGTLW